MQIIEYLEKLRIKSKYSGENRNSYINFLKNLLKQYKNSDRNVYLEAEILIAKLNSNITKKREKTRIIRKLAKKTNEISEEKYKKYLNLAINFFKDDYENILLNFKENYTNLDFYDSFSDEILRYKNISETFLGKKIPLEKYTVEWKGIKIEFISKHRYDLFLSRKQIQQGSSFESKISNFIINYELSVIEFEKKMQKINEEFLKKNFKNQINSFFGFRNVVENLKILYEFTAENFLDNENIEILISDVDSLKKFFQELKLYFYCEIEEKTNSNFVIPQSFIHLSDKIEILKNFEAVDIKFVKSEMTKFLDRLFTKEDCMKTFNERKPLLPVFFDLGYDFIDDEIENNEIFR